jgi:hypothetical protein
MAQRFRALRSVASLVMVLAGVMSVVLAGSAAAATTGGTLQPQAMGQLDCNGDSPTQITVRHSALCADIRGFEGEDNANTWNSRFYDNGVYIGHDEPDMTFLSNQPGSGNDVTWTEVLPRDPRALPTVRDPGHDVTHYFELSPAPWFSMAICDPNSYPEAPCKPESDSNATTCVGVSTTNCYAGGGSAFLEFQFYPPGMPPFPDSISCDDTHWCASMVIWSLECTTGYTTCNNDCEEPGNAAFIQRNGVPTGPPNPQEQNLASDTPNGETLLMNPGDQIQFHMFDAPVPGGGEALEIVLKDLTTGQTGWMQASAANGFANTSPTNCAGTPFNFQPEYSTASAGNYVPWAADETNIGEAVETGHWEPCTSVTEPGSYSFTGSSITDTYYNVCNGPYEDNDADEGTEPSDAFCYPAGDTHGALDSQPDLMTGCEDDLFQNGDLDFDGSPYYQSEWPVGPQPTRMVPSSFVQLLPTSHGQEYQQYFDQTDIALSESTCSGTTTAGCSVPPVGPGGGYPYYSRVSWGRECLIEFGNVNYGQGVDNLGGEAQYGSDQIASLGYPQFVGPTLPNSCGRPYGHHHY